MLTLPTESGFYLRVIQISFSNPNTQTYISKPKWHIQTQTDLTAWATLPPAQIRHTWGLLSEYHIDFAEQFTLLPCSTHNLILSPSSRRPSSTQFLPTLASPNRQQLSSQNPSFEQPHSHQSSNVGFLPLSLIWSIPHCTINTLQSASHQSLWVRSQSWAATDGQCFKNKSSPSVTMFLKWQWCSVGCRKVRR